MQNLSSLIKQISIQPAILSNEKTIEEHKEISNKFFTFLCKKILQTWSNEKRKTFEIDDENIEVIKLLVLYFSNNPAFENYYNDKTDKQCFDGELSLKKGIYLVGNVGSGKTLILELINKMLEVKFMIVACDIITDNVRIDGVGSYSKYCKIYKDNSDTELNNILFDDLGVESKAKYYGDVINPMYDILMRRYRAFCNHGVKTHFTSNVGLNDLVSTYDIRFESRIKEMCNIIKLGGSAKSKDRRK